ncbi:MAG: hypothetical protein ACHQAY_22360 [Hyphomicrobiales bacterium]
MGWLKVGIVTTIVSALVMVGAMVLLSILQKGVEPISLLSIVLVGLPLGLIIAAPVCLVILPLADALLEPRGFKLFRDLMIVGAVAGALMPLLVIFVLKIRPPGMVGTITALLVLAGLVGGAASGLFYAEILARLDRR